MLNGYDKARDYRSEYHARLKKLFNVRYAFSFCAGRACLYMLLKAAGVKEGDEVVIQGFTCAVVPKAVMWLGAKPVYADITAEDYNLSLASVKTCVTERTKAVVIQHSFGVPCHAMEDIIAFCRRKGILVIEDCAHTLGVQYNGRMLGTFADAAFFSTDHTKYISTSVGGFCITNNDKIGKVLEEMYEKLPELTTKELSGIKAQLVVMNVLRNKRILYLAKCCRITRAFELLLWIVLGKCIHFYYLNDYRNTNFPTYSFPAKLSELQCMIGMSQLDGLPENIKRRRLLTEKYKSLLDHRYTIPNDTDSPLRMPVLYGGRWEDVEGAMKGLLAVENWFNPALECITEDDFGRFHYNPSECPVAQHVAAHIVNLPVHQKVSNSEVEEICRRMNALLD